MIKHGDHDRANTAAKLARAVAPRVAEITDSLNSNPMAHSGAQADARSLADVMPNATKDPNFSRSAGNPKTVIPSEARDLGVEDAFYAEVPRCARDDRTREIRAPKTNPTAHSGARDELPVTARSTSENDKTNPKAHSGARKAHPVLTSVTSETDKTNPMAHSGARHADADGVPEQGEVSEVKSAAHCGISSALSPRQHAALRLLARGHGTMRVAKQLGVNRHTIARWKARPAFDLELQRMMQSLASSAERLRRGSAPHRWFDYLADHDARSSSGA